MYVFKVNLNLCYVRKKFIDNLKPTLNNTWIMHTYK